MIYFRDYEAAVFYRDHHHPDGKIKFDTEKHMYYVEEVSK